MLAVCHVYHTVYSELTCGSSTVAVMRDHTTDCQPTWNKCWLNHCLECMSSFYTHLSYSRPSFNIHKLGCFASATSCCDGDLM